MQTLTVDGSQAEYDLSATHYDGSRPVDDVPRTAGDGGLVARGRELAHLEHILWAARRGSANVVALRGEPGVGKSALIEAAVARATDFSVVQLRAAAMAGGSAAPREWPEQVVSLLRDPDRQAAARAADVLTELQGNGTGPLLVTIDDCHLLPERFSAALAEAVLDLVHVPLALVLAWRDVPHVDPFELDVLRVPEHHLEGLTLDQARALLTQQHVRAPSPPVLSALVESTRGNPGVLLEVCGALDAEQLEGWRPLPEPIRTCEATSRAFGARVIQLRDTARQALAAAAAARVPLGVLRLVLHEIGSNIDDLAPAEGAGIVAIRGNRLDFAHPLVRAAAFWSAPEDLRARVHGALTRAFSAGGYVERSAFHAAQIAARPDGAVTRLYAQAAQVALDRGDPEAAARHQELASDFAASHDEVAHHLVQAASLWATAGQSSRSELCVERALEQHPSDAIRAEALYRRAQVRLRRSVADTVAAEMVDAAVLSERDAPNRAVPMLLDAAACRLLHGGYLDTGELVRRAVGLARGVSSHAEALAQATLGVTAAVEGAPLAETGPALEAVTSQLAGQTPRFAATPHLAFVIGSCLARQGQHDHAARWGRWIARCAARAGDRPLGVVPTLLQALVAHAGGRLEEALASARTALAGASAHGDSVLASRALAVLVDVLVARGDADEAFELASRLFAVASDTGSAPRLEALVSLAALEVQRGRSAAAAAWLAATREELAGAGGPGPSLAARALVAPTAAEVSLLGRLAVDTGGLVEIVDRASDAGAVPPAWMGWVQGLCAEALDDAADHFREGLHAARGMPVVEGRIELAWGVRLAAAGRADEGRQLLEASLDRLRRVHAFGWVSLVEHELARALPVAETAAPVPYPAPAPDVRAAAGERTGPEPASGAPRVSAGQAAFVGQADAPEAPLAFGRAGPGRGPAAGEPTPEAPPPWQVRLLGSFSVRRLGREVSLPLSLAAQAVKIVALRERIPVEELVEILWAEAEPGVGTRRLRNVLWRVRAACGDLLQREGNFIRLAPEAISDVPQFRSLATRALDRHTPADEVASLARQALEVYRGELLPGDRYADWAAGPRESLNRLHLQLLDLLLAEAIRDDRRHDALVILDRLIDADPYDEHYYLQAAELHARAGNRRRALSILGRAERMLAELGVASSPSLAKVRNSLGLT